MSTDRNSFAAHNHDVCRREAMERAQRICAARGVRLTPIRRRTLELLWESHKPSGAYDLMERLGQEGFSAHPPTVYRALDFLVAQGLAHKVLGASAFIGCARPDKPHAPRFLICDVCGEMREFFDAELEKTLDNALDALGFEPRRVSLEVSGTCAPCRASRKTSATGTG